MRSAALALSTLVVLTACPASTLPPAVSPTPTSTPTPRAGGTLIVAVRDLDSFDPAKAVGRGALSAVSQVFEPLTRIDPETNRVRPAAAARWTVSRNGLVWRFHLAGKRFHNGTPVRAGDFKFAFDRIARTETRSEAAFQLEQVRGFRAVKIDDTTNSLAGVTAQSRRILRIELDRPFAELAYMLAHPALVPLPRARYQRNASSLRRRPIGNGPFRVVRASNERAVLEPFDGYRGADPYLDAIRYQVVRSVEAGWRAYRDGDVHVTEVPPAAVDPGTSLYGEDGFTPFWALLSFGFNLERPMFRKPEVRRAISLAIDREAIAASVYGNTRDPATGIIPQGVRGYVPEACTVCVRDIERASQILDAAFGARKPTLFLDALNESSSKQVARAIQDDLEEVGFRVRLRAHARKAYLDLLESGRHGLAQLGWLSEVPSPDGFLHQQLRSRQLNNHTGFSNATFDRALDRARRERDPSRRIAFYQRAEEIALDLMPLVPVVFFRNRTAVAPKVHGFLLNGAGLFDGTRVWLES